ncbi:16S rRNA (guanine(527)-N(7))-methyltransferase RsmG [Solimicrobium silvestre]|uniref:Ribosomal RNA small subunit methyltransferase G n=1 Tax=Solimicrobium silvestre TaxID=2099400 RepID=A0A2S9GSG4_9BURK|nr:16S rRNA (guanine(527)-N(7))-methyltransferase RsmG [Solimicrobium silvestre]PRC90636.1 gidB: 16S rRNA (guanine(527)-N(7))-methyltransferase GidB [Solimicrobium silvestre]
MLGLQEQVECRKLLEEGVVALQLNLDVEQCNKLMSYLNLLSKWNAVYNLTSVRNPREMVKQHLLDSLSAVSVFNHATNILDVGSGGGLPGIVLAIVYPDIKVALIDTVNKKTAFLKQVKAELDLKNVTVHTGRVEQLTAVELFDVITSRAFSELANFVNWAGHLLAPEGSMIALKGHLPEHEIEVLPAGWQINKVQAVSVPGLDAQRHLLWLVRA